MAKTGTKNSYFIFTGVILISFLIFHDFNDIFNMIGHITNLGVDQKQRSSFPVSGVKSWSTDIDY